VNRHTINFHTRTGNKPGERQGNISTRMFIAGLCFHKRSFPSQPCGRGSNIFREGG
jgi:hypothetical protein